MPWPILGISSNGNTFEDLRRSKDSLTRKPRSLPTTVIQLQPYLYRHWKVNICFEANYKDIIVCFHKSVVRGDLSLKFMVSTLDKIRAVEKMFCGKDREPRWYTTHSNMGEEQDSSDDEEMPQVMPLGYFDQVPPDLVDLLDALQNERITDDGLCELTDEEVDRRTKRFPDAQVAGRSTESRQNSCRDVCGSSPLRLILVLYMYILHW